jgi:hypothetical protein
LAISSENDGFSGFGLLRNVGSLNGNFVRGDSHPLSESVRLFGDVLKIVSAAFNAANSLAKAMALSISRSSDADIGFIEFEIPPFLISVLAADLIS